MEITGPFGAQALPVVVDERRRRLRGAARVRSAGQGSRVPGRARPAHADRAGLAARVASQARPEADACRTGRITRTTRRSRSRPGRSSSSTSRSGRPASSCPQGYRIALTIRGKDYEYEGEAATLSNMKNPMRGCGPFVHDDPQDRPPEIFGGKVTLHAGDGAAAVSCCCRSSRETLSFLRPAARQQGDVLPALRRQTAARAQGAAQGSTPSSFRRARAVSWAHWPFWLFTGSLRAAR